jgi:hypothetical protein
LKSNPKGRTRTELFEDNVLRRIFGSKREEEWRKLHNEKLHNLYSSPNVILAKFLCSFTVTKGRMR